MVKIRLSRGGAMKRPFYHIVVTDGRSRRDGRYIERLGFFNPIASGSEPRLQVDLERTEHWLQCGAQTTERVAHLIKEYRRGGQAGGGAPSAGTEPQEGAQPSA